ncbi:hypothetical protein GCM10023219_25940 [Stakelama sediminis]|uniref:Conjugal transfer protein TraD n=1 Tax=Stakelama sediminis TaxID=463200 RepID=A0A840YYP6_9SPHN|nr:conjugal transfer protein TraD [Stakelama sediminis]MBB5718725.1 hypothetical protein [Stakelama sediminis]
MRKPRDYDAELRTLADKARKLKNRRQHQLGELVQATGADRLSVEELAGALLEAGTAPRPTREAWRKRGAAFFRGEREDAGDGARGRPGSVAPDDRSAQPASGTTGTP